MGGDRQTDRESVQDVFPVHTPADPSPTDCDPPMLPQAVHPLRDIADPNDSTAFEAKAARDVITAYPPLPACTA